MRQSWVSQYEAGVPSALIYPDETLDVRLTMTAARWPRRAAIRFYGRTIRYEEFDQLISQFAGALTSLGVRRGMVVGIMLPNLPQTVIAYYGAMRVGAVVTPINPLYVEAEITKQIDDSGCEVVLALESFYPRLGSLIGRTRLRNIVLTSVQEYLPWVKRMLYSFKTRASEQSPSIPTTESVSQLRKVMRAQYSPDGVATSLDDLALLQYTGGTTGVPKGVMLTHRNLLANTWQCRSWMPLLSEGVHIFLGVLPFFHVYGMSACQNLCFSVGGTLVLLPRFQVAEVLQTIVSERVTVFPGIPSMYAAINNHQHLDRYDLGSVRLCISGAGPLPLPVQERFESLSGARLVEGYGLTEASPVTHVNPIIPRSNERRPRSIGLPLPDTEARIVDVEGGEQEVADGEVGELVVKGPQVMRGYWNRIEETRRTIRDGWLFTGDLARRDVDGFFYIQDRKKDMIKSGGENVFPREVEEILLQHPKIKEACVVGLPLGLRGELIKAYVVLKDGQKATAAEVLAHCRKDLARFKVPKRVEFRTELPKTLIGKVLRRVLVEEELKKLAETGALEGDEPTET